VSSARPQLSVVLATSHPWPEAEPTLRALLAADGTVDFEVLICDGSDGEDPGDVMRDDRLTVIQAGGESVFALRARGLAAARGEIVAITEDHCIPEPDWTAELVAAHARHPDAVAISGAVANGATEGAWDWANFLMTFAEHMRPIDQTAARRAPSVANGSFKRALVDLPQAPAPGWLELEAMPVLVSGGKVVRDGGPLVTHDQSHGGRRATLAAHFHNGRASAGLRADPPGLGAARAEARRLAGLPRKLIGELRDALEARPPLTGTAARGARLAPLVATAHAAGELTGLLTGPGSSPERLD
jgi:Glycosyl transferase family 2